MKRHPLPRGQVRLRIHEGGHPGTTRLQLQLDGRVAQVTVDLEADGRMATYRLLRAVEALERHMGVEA